MRLVTDSEIFVFGKGPGCFRTGAFSYAAGTMKRLTRRRVETPDLSRLRRTDVQTAFSEKLAVFLRIRAFSLRLSDSAKL